MRAIYLFQRKPQVGGSQPGGDTVAGHGGRAAWFYTIKYLV